MRNLINYSYYRACNFDKERFKEGMLKELIFFEF